MQPVTGKGCIFGTNEFNCWQNGRWNGRPNPFEDDLPEDAKPIKTIYVDDDGKLVVEYDDLEEE